MKKFLILFSILSFNTSAQSLPLPPAIPSVDDLIGEFRDSLSSKMNDLGKNFITAISNQTLLYSSSSSIKCRHRMTQTGQPVANMTISFKKSEGELIEKVIYTGCHNQITLVEDVVTKGENLSPISFEDFLSSKRSFELNKNEKSRFYRLSNSDNEEIFKMLLEKTSNGKRLEFYFLSQKILQMNYEFEADFTRLTLTYSGYKAKYVRPFSSFEFNSDFDPFSNVVLVKKGRVVESSFFSTRGELLSQSDFLKRLNGYLINGPLSQLRNLIEYHIRFFPETNVVQRGNMNEKLKEELRIAFNRLQNNTELNLVKKQIQDYMEAAEQGQLIDNRPKE